MVDNSYWDKKAIVSIEKGKFSIYTVLNDNAKEEDIQQLIEKANNQYTNFPEYNTKHTCMTLREYYKKREEYYFNSCERCSEEKFNEMLEILPPIWLRSSNYKIDFPYKIQNIFAVSEALSGEYHRAFIQYYNVLTKKTMYATKIVDPSKFTTWFNNLDLEKLESLDEKYRVWIMINPPREPEYILVNNIVEALLVLETLGKLAEYLPYNNCSGLEVLDEDGDWIEWQDEDGNDIEYYWDHYLMYLQRQEFRKSN